MPKCPEVGSEWQDSSILLCSFLLMISFTYEIFQMYTGGVTRSRGTLALLLQQTTNLALAPLDKHFIIFDSNTFCPLPDGTFFIFSKSLRIAPMHTVLNRIVKQLQAVRVFFVSFGCHRQLL